MRFLTNKPKYGGVSGRWRGGTCGPGTAYGITVDQAYRFMRIGYPVIIWLVSAGRPALS